MKVLVLGTFDLVHAGHIHLFQLAAGYGELHVGVAHDALVREFKGVDRPIFPMSQRIYIIKACRYVSKVHVYGNPETSRCMDNEDAQKQLVERLEPDIFVQGADKDKNPDLWGYLEKKGIQRISTPRLDAKFITTTHYIQRILLGSHVTPSEVDLSGSTSMETTQPFDEAAYWEEFGKLKEAHR